MLCEECNKENANVMITVFMNGEKRVRHLCQDCVKKLHQSFTQGDIQSFLSSMMSSLSSSLSPSNEGSEESTQALACSRCKLPYEVFQKTGKLGCAQCYTDFREELKPLLLSIHGRSQHAGHSPKVHQKEEVMEEANKGMAEETEVPKQAIDEAVSEIEINIKKPRKAKENMNINTENKLEIEIRELRKQMDEAILIENFEQAALIRDRLKELTKAIEGDGK